MTNIITLKNNLDSDVNYWYDSIRNTPLGIAASKSRISQEDLKLFGSYMILEGVSPVQTLQESESAGSFNTYAINILSRIKDKPASYIISKIENIEKKLAPYDFSRN